MQISSENYINVLTDLVKSLTIENSQLKAYIMDLQAKSKETSDRKTEKRKSDNL